ncbi:hypothetical protein XA68_16468 [Ophiocordyceps unilateralis]|uniref:Thioesterase domain-containing protein n=1 Tax=Ophiocordyceps unilateralis TaxID=268505 RepID=A0A2A9P695_OPHUN|nr:hypothetical protein XA68_16468 [Ophiocordyceps unilateralis]
MTMTTSDSLAKATTVTQLDATTFAATLQPAFCFGSVPNGGYVASIFHNAARAFMATRGGRQTDVIAVHWQFLSRTQAGPAVFKVMEAKSGRAVSVLHLKLLQHGLLSRAPWCDEATSSSLVVAYVTCAAMDAEVGVSLPTGWLLSTPPPPVDLAELVRDREPNWRRMWTLLMDRHPLFFRKIDMYMPRHGHGLPATQDLWIRLASGEPFTDTALGFVADVAAPLLIEAFRPTSPDAPVPPAGFAYSDSFWFPTLTMSLDVKKRLPWAGAEWLRLHAEASVIRNGRFDSRFFIFDRDGDLVAWSSQVAMVVDYGRNQAKRTTKM